VPNDRCLLGQVAAFREEKGMEYALGYLAAEIERMKEQKLFRYPRVLSGRQMAKCIFDGKEVVNLSSNNYLGFATHPRMVAAAEKAIRELGVGSGAVRTIAGTMEGHTQLERKIAQFKHTEAALVFQSGFTANAGTVSAVLGKNDIIISDELNHASIIDGCKLSRAEIKVFRHGDMVHLKEKLEESKPGWGYREAGPDVQGGEGVRRHNDGGRCSCQRSAGQKRARDCGSLRYSRHG
jgi:7-keto-8-aminopelargonate synthetase-like enzyme